MGVNHLIITLLFHERFWKNNNSVRTAHVQTCEIVFGPPVTWIEEVSYFICWSIFSGEAKVHLRQMKMKRMMKMEMKTKQKNQKKEININ